MDKIILIFCSLVSCIITVNILFQFMNDRFEKAYENQLLYRLLPIGGILLITGANTLMMPVLNMAVHIFLFGAVSCFLYSDGKGRKINQIVEVEVLYMVMAVSETLGVLALDVVLNMFGRIPESPEILQSMETAFSKVTVLFLYYVIYSRLWKKTKLRTRMQYILYLIMFLYSSVNILVTSFISWQENPITLMMVVGCIIFFNMYMLYFVRFSDERNAYKLQVEMMQQQERLQYENYEIQMEKYADVMGILHDVDKHIRQMEKLYQEKLAEEASVYTRQINDMLHTLAPSSYTNNSILNCLLSDKVKAAQKAGIQFEIKEFAGDINFMRPVDVTTLFGNVIDNAMTAAALCGKDKHVSLSVNALHEMVSVRVTNSVCHKIPIKNGEMPDKGIGILNMERCVSTYGGSILYQCEDRVLICDIMLNRVEVS